MTNQDELTRKVTKVILSEEELPHEEYINLLKESTKKLPYKGTGTFLGNPALIDNSYMENSSVLCSILNSVLVHIVYNYFRDVNIQDAYKLDKELQEILVMTEGIPYELGMYSPEFIFDINGNPGIYEISCKLPINGWMLSTYINQAVDNLAKTTNKAWSAIPKQNDFISEFSNRFDSDDTLFFIHKKENGIEVQYLQNELSKQGINLVGIQPEDLEVVDGQLKVGNEIARQFYLEMDREELKLFDKEVLRAIIKSGRCINDIRTIILIHDKRILSILCNERIMASYLNIDEFQFLKTYLIPSFTIDRIEDREFLLNSEANWILKPNSGKKGIDVLVKSECPLEIWTETVQNKWKDYMIQPYFQQKKFELNHNGSKELTHLTAMDLCFNGKYFGPGIFKASIEAVISTDSDKTIILPCVVENREISSS